MSKPVFAALLHAVLFFFSGLALAQTPTAPSATPPVDAPLATYEATLRAFLAVNEDLLDESAAALNAHRVFDLKGGPDGCRKLLSTAARNEFDARAFLEAAVASYRARRSDLSAGSPRVRFSYSAVVSLGAYDFDRKGFSFLNAYLDGVTIGDRIYPSPVGIGWKQVVDQPPAAAYCNQYALLLAKAGVPRVLTPTPDRFAIAFPGADEDRTARYFLPMERDAAEAYRERNRDKSRVNGDTLMRIDFVVDAVATRATTRRSSFGQDAIVAEKVVARFVDPSTGDVLRVYERTREVGEAASESPARGPERLPVLTPAAAGLLAYRDAADFHTDDLRAAAIVRILSAERRLYDSYDEQYENRARFQPLDYSWEEANAAGDARVAEAIRKAYLGRPVDWSFVRDHPEFDSRKLMTVRATIFNPRWSKTESVEAIARGKLPVFKAFLDAAAARIPDEMALVVPLASLKYDASNELLKIDPRRDATDVEKALGLNLLLEPQTFIARSKASAQDLRLATRFVLPDELANGFVHAAGEPMRIMTTKVKKARQSALRDGLPEPLRFWGATTFGDALDAYLSGGASNTLPRVRHMAFDRAPALSALPIPSAEASKLLADYRAFSRDDFTAHLRLSSLRGHRGSRKSAGVLSAKIDAVDIYDHKDRYVTTVPADALLTKDRWRREATLDAPPSAAPAPAAPASSDALSSAAPSAAPSAAAVSTPGVPPASAERPAAALTASANAVLDFRLAMTVGDALKKAAERYDGKTVLVLETSDGAYAGASSPYNRPPARGDTVFRRGVAVVRYEGDQTKEILAFMTAPTAAGGRVSADEKIVAIRRVASFASRQTEASAKTLMKRLIDTYGEPITPPGSPVGRPSARFWMEDEGVAGRVRDGRVKLASKFANATSKTAYCWSADRLGGLRGAGQQYWWFENKDLAARVSAQAAAAPVRNPMKIPIFDGNQFGQPCGVILKAAISRDALAMDLVDTSFAYALREGAVRSNADRASDAATAAAEDVDL